MPSQHPIHLTSLLQPPDEAAVQLALIVNAACTNMANKALFRNLATHSPHPEAWAEAALSATTVYNKPYLLFPVTLLLQTAPEQAYHWARQVIQGALA